MSIEQSEKELKESEKVLYAWLQHNLSPSQQMACGPLLMDYARKTITYSQDLVIDGFERRFGIKRGDPVPPVDENNANKASSV